jgi:hypothetical protein
VQLPKLHYNYKLLYVHVHTGGQMGIALSDHHSCSSRLPQVLGSTWTNPGLCQLPALPDNSGSECVADIDLVH